jgi:hypothetical protein
MSPSVAIPARANCERPSLAARSMLHHSVAAKRSTAGTAGHQPNLFMARQLPNPSVKGTCLRQAPYVER